MIITTKTHEVVCDRRHPNIRGGERAFVGELGQPLAEVRRAARLAGWRTTSLEDLCPAHNERR